MSARAVCLSDRDVSDFAAGRLSGQPLDAAVKHLDSCAACFAKAQTLAPPETLLRSLQRLSSSNPEINNEAVRRMTQRLSKAESESVAFSCTSCGKNLRVKAELRGKKVKCPGCGQAAVVPAAADVTVAPANETVAPKSAPPREAMATQEFSQKATQPAEDEDESDEPQWDFLAPPQAPDEIGRLGEYRVVSVLGHGGMGVVFKAMDPHLERPVALKAMLPQMASSGSAKKRFLREAKLAASITHDHIVRIYQVGEDRGAPYLAMEFLEGEPLDVRLKQQKKLPLGESIRIGIETAEGLAAAHDKQLIHRDIKPGNIWLEGKRARVKILDFGLARSASDAVQLTQSGAVLGTPSYMAPEQASGKQVDHRCDLFSLGVMLYRLVTGEMPFKGDNTLAIFSSLAMDTPTAPRKIDGAIPRPLSELIMKLLEKDPTRRYADAHEVADALRAISISDSMQTPPTKKMRPLSSASPGAKPLWARPWVLGIAAMVVLAPILWLLSGILLRVETANGTLLIDVNDPNCEVLVKQGNVIVQDRTTKREFQLKAGAGVVEVYEKDGIGPLTTKEFTLNRNGETKVTVRLEPRIPAGDPKTTAPAGTGPAQYALDFNVPQTEKEMAHLKVPQFQTGKPLTVEFYMTLRGRPKGPRTCSIFNAYGQLILMQESQSDVFFHASNAKERISIHRLELNRRFHLAAVSTGRELRLFIDGKLQGKITLSKSVEDLEFPAVIGGSYKAMPAWDPLDATMDQFRLSQTARYESDFTPPSRMASDAETTMLYDFEEGSGDQVKDASGHGNHGRITLAKWVKAESSPTPPASPARYALDFNVPQSETEMAHLKVPQFQTGKPLTVEFYMTLRSRPNGQRARNIFNSFGVILMQAIHSDVYFHASDEKEQLRIDRLELGQRFHLAAVSTGRELRLFIDGKLQGKIAHSKPVNEGNYPAFVGGYFEARPAWDPLDATLDQFRLSQTARYESDFTPPARMASDAETTMLYDFEEGAGNQVKDASGHGNHGRITLAKWVKIGGASSAPELGKGSRPALRFAGPGQHVTGTIPYELNKPWTAEQWVVVDKADPIRDYPGNGYTLMSGSGWFIYARDIEKLGPRWTLGIKGGKTFFTSKAPFVFGKPQHLAVTHENNQVQWFIDGVAQGSVPVQYSEETAQFSPGISSFQATNGRPGFYGSVAEIRLSKNVRYTGNFSAAPEFQPDENTLALFHCNEGSGTVLKDASKYERDVQIVGAKWGTIAIPSVKSPPLQVKAPAEFDLIRLLRETDRIKVPHFTEANTWSWSDGKLTYHSDGKSGKLMAPLSLNDARDFEFETKVRRLSGNDVFTLDLLFHPLRQTALDFFIDGTIELELEGDKRTVAAWPKSSPGGGTVKTRVKRLGGGKDSIVVTIDGKTAASWQGDFEKIGRPIQFHPEFTGQMVPSLFCLKDSFEFETWKVHVFDGEAKPLRSQTPSGTGTIDLLKRIDVDRDSIGAKWTLKNGVLHSPADANNPKLALPDIDVAEYDFAFNVERIVAGNSFVVALPVEHRRVALVMDAYASKGGKFWGLEMAGGKGPFENSTLVQNQPLEIGKPAEVRVEVRKRGVKVFRDRVQLIAWKGRAGELSLSPVWAKGAPAKGFFLGSQAAFLVRKLELTPAQAEVAGIDLLRKGDLSAFDVKGAAKWEVTDGILRSTDPTTGFVITKEEFADYELSLDYKLPPKGNSGVFLRCWPDGPVNGAKFMEFQLIDEAVTKMPLARHGALFGASPPQNEVASPLDQWNQAWFRLEGRRLKAKINGVMVQDVDLDTLSEHFARFPGLEKTSGAIGLQQHGAGVEFRNIRVQRLNSSIEKK